MDRNGCCWFSTFEIQVYTGAPAEATPGSSNSQGQSVEAPALGDDLYGASMLGGETCYQDAQCADSDDSLKAAAFEIGLLQNSELAPGDLQNNGLASGGLQDFEEELAAKEQEAKEKNGAEELPEEEAELMNAIAEGLL